MDIGTTFVLDKQEVDLIRHALLAYAMAQDFAANQREKRYLVGNPSPDLDLVSKDAVIAQMRKSAAQARLLGQNLLDKSLEKGVKIK